MWTITNYTRYAAERCWVRDKSGGEVWLVAVKGTFSIAPDGSTSIAAEQQKVCLAPVYRAKPGESSLLYDSDLYHTKVNTDILVNAHAYAPQGRLSKQVDVTLRVANVNKTLRVFGDRLWNSALVALVLSDPRPFLKMPLSYERAVGGRDWTTQESPVQRWDERNPVGIGFAMRQADLIGKPAPNVESLTRPVRKWSDRPDPVGYGPIAGHWKPRVLFGGTYDEKWRKERQPLLPEDFDERFYQSAPPDQQTKGFLMGGETVELLNMTPTGVLAFELPRQTLGFKTDFEDGTSETHPGKLHSVIIEPDVPRVMLVWHTLLPCHHKALKLKTTHVTVKRRIRAAKIGRVREVA